MPSFEKILSNTPIGDIKDPPPFPPGTYLCVTTDSGAWGESARKKTKQYQWKAKILQPKEDVSQEKLMQWKDETSESVSGQEVFPTFYSDARLAEFLRALGFGDDVPGPVALAQSAGKQFLLEGRHEPSQDGKKMVFAIAGYKPAA